MDHYKYKLISHAINWIGFLIIIIVALSFVYFFHKK
jgi:hypothetical protein